MTQEELIKEIKQLPLDRQREVLDVILREVREKTEPPQDRTSIIGSLRGISKTDSSSDPQPEGFRDGDLSISQRLYGILKFENGPPPTDDEVKDMIADYLLEKYS